MPNVDLERPPSDPVLHSTRTATLTASHKLSSTITHTLLFNDIILP